MLKSVEEYGEFRDNGKSPKCRLAHANHQSSGVYIQILTQIARSGGEGRRRGGSDEPAAPVLPRQADGGSKGQARGEGCTWND